MPKIMQREPQRIEAGLRERWLQHALGEVPVVPHSPTSCGKQQPGRAAAAAAVLQPTPRPGRHIELVDHPLQNRYTTLPATFRVMPSVTSATVTTPLTRSRL